MPDITVSIDTDSSIKNRYSDQPIHQFFPNAQLYMEPYSGQLRVYRTGDILNFNLYPEAAANIFAFAVTYQGYYGLPSHMSSNVAREVEVIIGGASLTGLADAGTAAAFDAASNNMSAANIDSFFTDLPTASYNATLNFQSNPGSATCTPSIATAKGYTVIT
jgi:hypothetical protein